MSSRTIREHTGISLGITGILVAFFMILPALIVVAVYSFLTIYAIVKAVGSAPDSASSLTVMLGVVLIVSLLITLLGAGIAFVGRSFDPRDRTRKRRFLRRPKTGTGNGTRDEKDGTLSPEQGGPNGLAPVAG